ncbi:MAG: hypothetical protein U0736_23800 [Gemmataceae bacterium]
MPPVEPAGAVTGVTRRVVAALRTYLARPLVWVLTLFYLAAVAAMYHGLHEPEPPFDRMLADAPDARALQAVRRERAEWLRDRQRTVTPSGYQPSPRAVLGPPQLKPSHPNARQPRPDEVRTLEVWLGDAEAALLWQAGRFPKVEAIVLNGEPVTDRQLAELVRLYRPRALYLMRADKLTAAGFDALATATTVEYLSVPGNLILTRAAELRWPANLRWLSVAGYERFPLARYEEWRQLPHLTSLLLQMSRDGGPDGFPADVVACLDAFPGAPTVYLHDYAGDDGPWAIAAQPQFRRVAIRPARAPKRRLDVAFWAFFLALLPTALAAVQLSGQGVLPWAVLTPGYPRPHMAVAACIWLTGAAVSVGLMMWLGVALLAAVAVSGCGPLYFAAWERLFRRESTGQAGYAPGGLALLPILLLMPMLFVIQFGLQMVPPVAGALDWFLAGQRPWLAAAWVVANVVVAGRLLRRLGTIVRPAAAAGLYDVPLGLFDVAGWTRVMAPWQGRRLEQQARWNPIWLARDRRLDRRLDAGPATTRRQRVTLWIAGLPMQPLDLVWLVLVVSVVQMAAFGGMAWYNTDVTFLPHVLWMPVVQGGGMFLVFPLFQLSGRRKQLPHELLWPVSRRDWMLDWFVAQARLLAPGATLLLAGGGALWWSVGAPTLTPAAVAGLAGSGVAALVLIWAGGLLLGTFASITAAVILLSLFVGGLSGSLMSITALTPAVVGDRPPVEATTVVALIALGMGVVSAVVTATMLYRWRTWEVGRM